MDSTSNICFKLVPTGQLNPNDYNPNRMTDAQLIALERAITKDGFCGVVLVNQTDKGLVIVDGEHRWRAAKKLGLKYVPCLVGRFPEEKARSLTIKLNQIHGYWKASELVSLLDSVDEPLADLGFSEQEFAAQLESAMDDLSRSPNVTHSKAEAREQNRIYVGFMLTSSQQRLLTKALNAAAKLLDDSSLSRSDALAEVLKEYVRQCKAR